MADACQYHKEDLHSKYGCRRNVQVSQRASPMNDIICQHNNAHGVRIVSPRTYHVYQKKFPGIEQMKCVKVFEHTDENLLVEDENVNKCCDGKSWDDHPKEVCKNETHGLEQTSLSTSCESLPRKRVCEGQTSKDCLIAECTLPQDDRPFCAVSVCGIKPPSCKCSKCMCIAPADAPADTPADGPGLHGTANNVENVGKQHDAMSKRGNINDAKSRHPRIFSDSCDALLVPETDSSKTIGQGSGVKYLHGLPLDVAHSFSDCYQSEELVAGKKSIKATRSQSTETNTQLAHKNSAKMSGSNVARNANASRVHETKKHGMGHLKYDKTPLPRFSPPDWPKVQAD